LEAIKERSDTQIAVTTQRRTNERDRIAPQTDVASSIRLNIQQQSEASAQD